MPRVRLGQLPTPLEEMPRLSEALGGPRLFVKRDDQTGLATGGNKTRKLEFVFGRALEQGADTVVTLGAPQSNHCRQTAAAAARHGLRCVLVLGGRRPDARLGNLLLDELLGADIVFCGDRDREVVAAEVVQREKAAGRRTALVPLGASSPTGALGFVAAMEELHGQLSLAGINADRVVFASSSFGTQSGLCLGAKAMGFGGRLESIAVDSKEEHVKEEVARLAAGTADLLGIDAAVSPGDVLTHDGYTGEGYAVMGAREREAIMLTARTEGILLDPVYTGRAMGGLIDLIRRGAMGKDETVVFWHTGGAAALHAYWRELSSGQ